MHVFDASSIIHAWINYPIDNFPPMWNWFSSQIDSGEFSIPRVALEEVSLKSPECGKWLNNNDINVLQLTNDVLQLAAEIKHLLGIDEDEYHAKGVGENDLFIIATAKLSNATLVSDERRQFRLPDVMSKCKIPAVCDLDEVGVVCIPFIELIKGSGAIFS
ncbi:MAG: DUF4411 family protein [Candidatus Thiodiazotropha endolucinida]